MAESITFWKKLYSLFCNFWRLCMHMSISFSFCYQLSVKWRPVNYKYVLNMLNIIGCFSMVPEFQGLTKVRCDLHPFIITAATVVVIIFFFFSIFIAIISGDQKTLWWGIRMCALILKPIMKALVLFIM